jgi:SAM-dependent methyltransferase
MEDCMSRDAFGLFRELFFEKASIFKKTFIEVEAEFGDEWKTDFGIHLEHFFGTDEAAQLNAIRGYTKFAVDAMRLQRRFNQTKRYEDVSYEEACERVYLNADYMKTLYLPGIFVSHFLWRHHYRQLQFYRRRFLPLVERLADKNFYEVGTGSGFYTVQLLRNDPSSQGTGIDISPSSREFTQAHVAKWGFLPRFRALDLDITKAQLEPRQCLQTIEVLEHLTDPQPFLNHLRRLLRSDGVGFVTAALTAPNADHIYLYWTPDEVIQQLQTAGFRVIDFVEEAAYQGKPGEYVPKVAAFIVS